MLPVEFIELSDGKTVMPSLRKWFGSRLYARGIMTTEFLADGLGVHGKNISALMDPAFADAYQESSRLNSETWRGQVPDIRWRAHVCCWAGRNALSLQGDFVECGVNAGLLSVTVAHFLNFSKINRTFWLFDTFAGVPIERVPMEERRHIASFNAKWYSDCWDIAVRNFAPFPNAKLVRGILPDTLSEAPINRISYLSVDLNYAEAEMAVMERLWPKLTPGAIVVIDDYAFVGHEIQFQAWNEFARDKGQMILTVPTGQGLLIKPLA